MAFESKSQAGQDRFVHALLPKVDGVFLDIGSSHPVTWSNTYALERLGWSGLLIDNDPGCEGLTQQHRPGSEFLSTDATAVDWSVLLPVYFTPSALPVDYLSLDVDGATQAVVERFPWSVWRFAVLTVEHDAYRFGPGPRDAIRSCLLAAGYHLFCADVHSNGCPFEDWWVDLDVVAVPSTWRSEGMDWIEVVSRLEAWRPTR